MLIFNKIHELCCIKLPETGSFIILWPLPYNFATPFSSLTFIGQSCNFMKRPIAEFLQSFTAFTRTERYGVVALCSLLVVLLAWRMAIPYLAQPAVSQAEEQQLVAAGDVYKRSQVVKKKAAISNPDTALVADDTVNTK